MTMITRTSGPTSSIYHLYALVREDPRKAAALLLWALTGFVLVYGVLLAVLALRALVAVFD
jgi:hypothetical protein